MLPARWTACTATAWNWTSSGGTAELCLSDADGELLRVTLTPERAMFALPTGRTMSRDLSGAQSDIRVFVDRCSVECFVGGGEACFTQRV